MLKLQFSELIVKVNKRGTGFIKLPKEKRELFKLGERVKILIQNSLNPLDFSTKISKHNQLGVYVPLTIMKQINVFHKYELKIEKIKGFVVKMNYEGRVYLPNDICMPLKLKHGDVVKMKVLIKGKRYEFYKQINVRKKQKTTEYFIFLPKLIFGNEMIMEEISKCKNELNIKANEINYKEILKNFTFTLVNNKNVILFLGNRKSVIINKSITFDDVAHYLGCFFADGTKRGNDWGICASTFEQAIYYEKMHRLIISDSNIKYSLTITVDEGKENSVKNILKLWKRNTNISVDAQKVYLFRSKKYGFTNRNKVGTLVFKEHRQITQMYYNSLIKCLLEKIRLEKRTDLAQKFICGVMEGDGCLNARGRGHIQITTNANEVGMLEDFLKESKLKYRAHKEEKTGKVYVNVGGMSIMENLPFLGNILFMYYPKRRKILADRLCNTPAAKYLLKKQKTLPFWMLKHFRENGILNKDNKITMKGMEIRKALSDLAKSTTVL